MATIVNNPNGGTQSENGTGGWIIAGAIILVVALIAIFVWPGFAEQDAAPTQTIPAATNNRPDVNNNTFINASTTINNSTTTEE